jgi:hypothetical protein
MKISVKAEDDLMPANDLDEAYAEGFAKYKK